MFTNKNVGDKKPCNQQYMKVTSYSTQKLVNKNKIFRQCAQ